MPKLKTYCYICGAFPANQPLAIKDSFTAHTRCKSPNSNALCDRCYDCLEGKYKQCWYFHPTKEKWSKLWGRNWSWLISDSKSFPTFHNSPFDDGILEVRDLPTRVQIREWLLSPPEPPFTIALAVSGQKHTYPFAVASQSRDLFPVLFEDTLLYCDRQDLTRLFDNFEALMGLGFNKSEITIGDYSSIKLMELIKADKYGAFDSYESIVSGYRGGDLIKLAEFCAQKNEP